jgi:hypothetical protein
VTKKVENCLCAFSYADQGLKALLVKYGRKDITDAPLKSRFGKHQSISTKKLVGEQGV